MWKTIPYNETGTPNSKTNKEITNNQRQNHEEWIKWFVLETRLCTISSSVNELECGRQPPISFQFGECKRVLRDYVEMVCWSLCVRLVFWNVVVFEYAILRHLPTYGTLNYKNRIFCSQKYRRSLKEREMK